MIVFREVFEAGLIVGLVLAATRGVARRGRIMVGVLSASLLAFFAGTLSDALAGRGQEIFNASILALAVAMLGWHNLCMAIHGREVARGMKAMGEAVAAGEKSPIASHDATVLGRMRNQRIAAIKPMLLPCRE